MMNLTCIVCPMGCQLEVELSDGKVVSVKGNTCPRGEKYAIDECTHPTRTLTSFVKVEGCEMASVKSEAALPKDKIFDCMKEINKVVLKAPVKIGDVVVENILGTGVNIVATKNI